MTDPVLVEVTRGTRVESRHRGAVAVVDAEGGRRLMLGDTDVAVFPRSSVKSIQALPLIESGAADAYGFGDKELSLACASHSGEAEHVAMAQSMLERAGVDESCLECGGHWSTEGWVMRQQSKIYDATPPAICNNCSGKHSGFICTSLYDGIDPRGYIGADHRAQQNVRDALQDVTGARHDDGARGIDGCSIPTYAIPLSAMALGFARMASGVSLEPVRAKAAKRLLTACMNEPFYMAGTGRFCTRIMELGQGKLFAKTGAEGVFCGAVPELGLGIALKCADGATRGAESMMAGVFAKLLPDDDPLQPDLMQLTDGALKNRNRMEVGRVRVQFPD